MWVIRSFGTAVEISAGTDLESLWGKILGRELEVVMEQELK